MNVRSREPSPDRPRVLVADDHRAMLESLIGLLSKEYDVVAALLDGDSVLSAATRHVPDVLVLDIAMPGMSGLAAAALLKKRGSTAKVVFVTMHDDPEYIQESLALGAVGFVVKNRLVSDLVPAIREVLAGHSFVSPSAER
jgi:DNA-binding NarL/FixJ family response regulator